MSRFIPYEIRKDFGVFLDSVIEDIAMETQGNISLIIKALCKKYNVIESNAKKCLKLVNSKFTSNNNVIFYNSGKWVKRTAHLSQTMSVIKKIGQQLKKIEPDIPTEFVINCIFNEMRI